ncbi:hypothetical protein HDV00_008511 [Rhizophlyctis rosea]|nr:hypothetical protein HDV00_008511 [Rhizophlyctis rosea]
MTVPGSPLILSNNALIAVIAAVASVPIGLFLGLYMVEVPCYVDYCVEHSYPTFKRGSQIALGVFYAWLVCVSSMMVTARKNPSLHRYLHKPLHNSTAGFATYTLTRGEFLFHLSITLLILSNLIFFLSIARATVDGPEYDAYRSTPGRILSCWLITMGTLSVFFLLLLVTTAIPYIRRNNFNLFYYTHFFSIPALLFAWLHAPSDFYYCIPGLIVYFTDVVLRFRNERKTGVVLNVRKEKCGYLRVDFAWPEEKGGKIDGGVAGKWVFVQVREVSRFEWHPYSLANGVESEVGTLLLKPDEEVGREKEFESRLARVLCERLEGVVEERVGIKIGIDGPFGEMSFIPEDQDYIVCFVAGTGLAPAIAILRQWIARREQLSSADANGLPLHLIWTLKESGGEDVPLLKELALEGGSRLSIHVAQTGEFTDDVPIITDKPEVPFVNVSEKQLIATPVPITTSSITTSLGRINVTGKPYTNPLISRSDAPEKPHKYSIRNTVFPSLLKTDYLTKIPTTAPTTAKPKLGISICGPPRFVASVGKESMAYAKKHKSGLQVSIHSEGYQW